jgi:hypothetical protein
MKKTQTRFIKTTGVNDKIFTPYSGNESNHSLRCKGYETKTVISTPDTHNYQMNTHNERIGLLRFVR